MTQSDQMHRFELVFAFRTFSEDDPFQRYVDRVFERDVEEDPTPLEAAQMMHYLLKGLPRLHPSAYGICLDLQAELLSVLAESAETGWPTS